MTRAELLDLCKHIIEAEQSVNAAVDKLLEDLGVTKEEAKNGGFYKEVDTC